MVLNLKLRLYWDSKIIHNKLYYLVERLGYSPSDRIWDLADNLNNAFEIVAEFHENYLNTLTRVVIEGGR